MEIKYFGLLECVLTVGLAGCRQVRWSLVQNLCDTYLNTVRTPNRFYDILSELLIIKFLRILELHVRN